MTVTSSERPPHDAYENEQWVQDYPELALFRSYQQPSPEDIETIHQFESLWGALDANIQTPIQDDKIWYGGYTGHRNVYFRSMGNSALGFHLMQNKQLGFRTIEAHRRKIYPGEVLRSIYTSDSFVVTTKEVASSERMETLQRQLGILSGWVDMFQRAEPYS
jgi:hypothetical protein